jgi:hypothetical protein
LTYRFLYQTKQRRRMTELTDAERAKIQNYVTTIMEGVGDSWEELKCATDEATNEKSVPRLKEMEA